MNKEDLVIGTPRMSASVLLINPYDETGVARPYKYIAVLLRFGEVLKDLPHLNRISREDAGKLVTELQEAIRFFDELKAEEV